jgi:mannose-6-phosphate isomerase-like protein (cupin superfamily)
MKTVNLATAFEGIDAPWTPKIAGQVNGMHVKLARFKGDFDWHSHADEDEMFLVIKGTMRMAFRDRVETVEAGEFIIVPRGTEHRPGAVTNECQVMLFEPVGTINTGDGAGTARTVTQLEDIR